jgi:hypothetical protein
VERCLACEAADEQGKIADAKPTVVQRSTGGDRILPVEQEKVELDKRISGLQAANEKLTAAESENKRHGDNLLLKALRLWPT